MSRHGAGCGLRAVDLTSNTRPIRGGTVRRRRKSCSACGARVTTYETYGPEVLWELGEREARKAVILVALDVDGTLDTSNGPLPWKLVEFLHFRTPPGLVRFAVVSASKAWPGTEATGIPSFALDPETKQPRSRLAALAAARAEYPWCTERFYVSDNPDRAEAAEAGFEYVDRNDWPRVLARVAEAAMKAGG